MLIWNNHFATGIDWVDSQHQILIENVNQMERLLDEGPPVRSTFDALLRFLEAYATTHFNCEEECMHRLKCPVQHQNKRAHRHFLKVFGEFKAQYDHEGPDPVLLRSMHQELSGWIEQHILALDTRLNECE